jgi:DNA-binding transcriptional MerR regulator/methylmalonyl-CoA mutase cobalamin-binding subunit
MYTIKQAAQRTGITIPTIRVWERRYGVVSPSRTAAGYRLYDDSAIARLNAMQRLVEHEGWRPSQAAERIRSADEAELDAIIGREPPSAGPSGSSDRLVVDAIVEAARGLDLPSIERTLDEAFAGQRFEAAMDAVVFPALRGIGDAWGQGELDVAREHAASETIRRRIAHYFDAATRGAGGRTVVVGLPPGSRHELGAFAFAVAARRAGLDVVYLGADVPVDAWRQTVRDTGASAAVIAVVSRSDVRPAAEVIRALRAGDLRAIAVGGPSAADLPADLDAVQLTGPLEAAVTTLVGAIGTSDR